MSSNATHDVNGNDASNYEFAVPCEGKVNVKNLEYGREEAKHHIYTVTVIDGQTTHCTCPADKYHDGQCKHRDGVERAPLVLYTASKTVATDGGTSDECEHHEPDCDVCDGTGWHGEVRCFAGDTEAEQ